MRLAELKANPKNPRKISDEKLKMLKKSLEEFGDLSGIIFNRRTKRLAGGHQRIKVLPQDAEITIEKTFKEPTRSGTTAKGTVLIDGEGFVYREVDWDENKEKAANIAANKHGGEWEIPLLAEMILELDHANFPLDLTGFDDKELADLLAPVHKVEGQCDEDEVPDVKEDPRSCRGDIYLLDNHRLMCGDSTSITDVEMLMNGEKAELCFTSPPYGDQREYNDKSLNLDVDHVSEFITASFNFVNYYAIVLGLMRKEGAVFPYWNQFIEKAQQCELKLLSWNVWNKMNDVLMFSFNLMFAVNHEWIFVFGKESKKLIPTVPNKHGGEYHDHLGVRQKDGSKKKMGAVTIREFSQLRTVIDCTPQKARNNDFDHPAMFSVELPEKYIEACVEPDGLVYEPFCGSGTTLIAAEKLGRRCFGMELDPHYCDVIVARWEKYTGKQAKLLNQGEQI